MKDLIPPIGSPDGLFHDGNPLTGELGTIVTALIMNDLQAAVRSIQNELISTIKAGSPDVILDESNATQLFNALKKLFFQADNNLSEISTAGVAAQTSARTNIGAAALAGLSSQLFSVASGTTDEHAINLKQLKTAISGLSLGTAAKSNVEDFISSGGGNYPAYLRLRGVETLPTEIAAANLSSLYSAPSPIQPGDVASGAVANWYNFQALYGLIRNASNGINGWGIKINGNTLFLVAPNGDCYANNQKLATESLLSTSLSNKQDKSQTLTDLSGKNPSQINAYLGLGTVATKNIGNGPGQVPDMSLFPLVGGANGYVKLPNGFIFQWGSANAGSGSANIAFPMQFPGGCVGVEITGTSARASADMSAVNIISGETNAGGFGVNGYLIRPGGQVVPQGIAFNYCAWGY